MDLKLIDTKHSSLMGKALDAYALRQKAIGANIANIDTPGYVRQEVNFEEQLQKASRLNAEGSDPSRVQPKLVEAEGKPQLEDEMFTLTDTQIRYTLVTKALRHNFSLLRAGITGRSGNQ
jgi:flagellar basal-body rod protein FlgB